MPSFSSTACAPTRHHPRHRRISAQLLVLNYLKLHPSSSSGCEQVRRRRRRRGELSSPTVWPGECRPRGVVRGVKPGQGGRLRPFLGCQHGFPRRAGGRRESRPAGAALNAAALLGRPGNHSRRICGFCLALVVAVPPSPAVGFDGVGPGRAAAGYPTRSSPVTGGRHRREAAGRSLRLAKPGRCGVPDGAATISRPSAQPPPAAAGCMTGQGGWRDRLNCRGTVWLDERWPRPGPPRTFNLGARKIHLVASVSPSDPTRVNFFNLARTWLMMNLKAICRPPASAG